MQKNVRVGVIGVGHLGQHHARIYSAMENVTLMGVADLDQNRANEIAKRCNCHAYTNYASFYNNVDAVSIASPTVMHHQIAKDFLERGIDVLVEKPITETPEQARELIDIAKAKNLILQVGHSERFNAGVKALYKQVKNPLFIEAHRLGTFVGRALDVDVVLDLMIHDLDIILDIVPSPVKSVYASGMPVLSHKIDISSVRVEFENGAVANITCSRISAEQMRKLRVFQPGKYISVDYLNQKLVTFSLVPETNPEGKSKFAFEKTITDVVPEEPLKAEITSFIECVQKRSRPIVAGEEGLRALEIAMEIKRQIDSKLKEKLHLFL